MQVDAGHIDKITAPILHPHSNATLLHGEMLSVDSSAQSISVRRFVGGSQSPGQVTELSYDYLLVGCGSEYPAPFKPSREEPTLASREATWSHERRQLQAAQSVIVVGGGLVGTELVGEILTRYPDKVVTVVDAAAKCCANLEASTVSYVEKWLVAHEVRLEMSVKIKIRDPSRGFPEGLAITDHSVTLEDGRVLEADVVYRCLGSRPAIGALKTGLSKALLHHQSGALLVEDTLQVPAHPRIFGMGDVMFHAGSHELKLGHTAEVNAHLVVENLTRHHAGEDMLPYPEGVTGAQTTPRIYCLSLGEEDGSLGFNGWVINGRLAGFVKAFLEWSKVRQQADTVVGHYVWHFGDWVSFLLGRTLLREDGAAAAKWHTSGTGCLARPALDRELSIG